MRQAEPQWRVEQEWKSKYEEVMVEEKETGIYWKLSRTRQSIRLEHFNLFSYANTVLLKRTT